MAQFVPGPCRPYGTPEELWASFPRTKVLGYYRSPLRGFGPGAGTPEDSWGELSQD